MKIQSGRLDKPDRTTIVGTAGVGKSTYAATASKALFVCCEEGSDELSVDRARNDDGSNLSSYDDVKKVIAWLADQPHEYRTIVIDTIDWLLIWIEQHMASKYSVSSVAEILGGYGKGDIIVAGELRLFLASLERLQNKRGVDVLFLAHAKISKFNPPDGEAYDRYDIKMPEKSAALVYEWSKNVLLAQLETTTVKADKHAKPKGYTDGSRVLRTQETAAYRAKNRFGLDPTIPFDTTTYSAIQSARKRSLTSDADLEAALEEILAVSSNPDATREWFKSQPNKSAALEALRAKASKKESA